jgi:DNA-binding CsgD family transcriptional regulator
MHAVTSAEQRVLNGLLDGLAAEEMARRFGVKLSTVRSQITALRNKLGVGRVTDAVRLAAGLPPMAGALRHQTRAAKLPATD